MARVVFEGHAKPMSRLMPDSFFGASPSPPERRPDLARARALLAEAGPAAPMPCRPLNRANLFVARFGGKLEKVELLGFDPGAGRLTPNHRLFHADRAPGIGQQPTDLKNPMDKPPAAGQESGGRAEGS